MIIRFPLRRLRAVLIVRARDDGGGWLACVGASGWVFGSRADAIAEARWLSNNPGGLPIRELVT
jgi:hypothetical protein